MCLRKEDSRDNQSAKHNVAAGHSVYHYFCVDAYEKFGFVHDRQCYSIVCARIIIREIVSPNNVTYYIIILFVKIDGCVCRPVAGNRFTLGRRRWRRLCERDETGQGNWFVKIGLDD